MHSTLDYAYPNGIVRNLAGASLDIQGDRRMDFGSVENLGKLIKSSGTNATELHSTLINRGEFQLKSGTLTVFSASTNSGTLSLDVNTTLKIDNTPMALEPGAVVSGAGTLLFVNNSQLFLLSDVNFGSTAVSFSGNSSVTGNSRMSNGPGGQFLIDHNMTIPLSMTVGGQLTLTSPSLTVTLTRNLTLLTTGTINNPATFRVGEFVNFGGTVVGNAPIVIGMPPTFAGVQITGFSLVPAENSTRPLRTSPTASVQLHWETESVGDFIIQSSMDLLYWRTVPAVVTQVSSSGYRADLPDSGASQGFFRVLARPPGTDSLRSRPSSSLTERR